MNEKRFNDAKGYIYDGKKCIGIINDNYTCENIINLLNALYEENQFLKEDNMLLIDDSEKYKKLSVQFDNRNKELISENEELKKDNINLHRAMSKDRDNYFKFRDKVFDLIDKNLIDKKIIKETDTIGAEVLKDLRRELVD